MISPITSCLRFIFGSAPEKRPKLQECKECEECKGKETSIYAENNEPCIVLSYLATYKHISLFPLENYPEPGCFIRIHTDQKVCFFAFQVLSQSEGTRFQMCKRIGYVTIQNDLPVHFSRIIPQLLEQKAQILTVKPKSTRTFHAFPLWFCFLFAFLSLNAHEPYAEPLHPHWAQSFEGTDVHQAAFALPGSAQE